MNLKYNIGENSSMFPLDNHGSHLSIDGLNYAKDNDFAMLRINYGHLLISNMILCSLDLC